MAKPTKWKVNDNGNNEKVLLNKACQDFINLAHVMHAMKKCVEHVE